ncbi:MAG: hypothetical protein ACYDBQ_02230 [Thermoplasmatota archaeon]
MKSELLLRIKEAEGAADQHVAQAEAQAKSLVAEARRQAEALLADAKTQSDFAYTRRLEKARVDGEEEAKRLLAAGQKRATQLKAHFEAGVAAALPRAIKIFEEHL